MRKATQTEMTNDANNTALVPDRLTGKYDFPVIKNSCTTIPSDIIPFNQAKTQINKNVGVHFFIDDYQFERVWKSPKRYIEMLKKYQCVFSPDFSLFLDMPLVLKMWNVYRSLLIGEYWQRNGINLIPTLQWAEPRTFDFCFSGIEKGSTVAVSTLGTSKHSISKQYWKDGMNEAVKRIEPAKILLYGVPIEFNFGNIPVVYYSNHHLERMRKYAQRKK